MDTPSTALYSTWYPLGCSVSHKVSARHFNKHVAGERHFPITLPSKVKLSNLSSLELHSDSVKRHRLIQPNKCAFTDNHSSQSKTLELLLKLKSLSFDSVNSVKEGLSELTPFDVCKLLGVATFAIAAAKWAVNLVFNPVLWMYFSWSWLFWPCIRKRLYGDYYPRPHDPKWDISVPNWYRALFFVGVKVGHWLAAFEGPELHLIPGGWSNIVIWGLIMVTLFMHYHASLYLAKYSEKVAVPTAVVQFGPYRWVRHPVYASLMLLFVTYFMALRARMSALFIVAVCVIYYDQKAKLEEALMLDTFGETYLEYKSKVSVSEWKSLRVQIPFTFGEHYHPLHLVFILFTTEIVFQFLFG